MQAIGLDFATYPVEFGQELLSKECRYATQVIDLGFGPQGTKPFGPWGP
jgi:hypothetical protein